MLRSVVLAHSPGVRDRLEILSTASTRSVRVIAVVTLDVVVKSQPCTLRM